MIDSQSLSCQEVVELVTDYLEGALDAADLRRFEEHLAGCENCTAYLKQLRQTIEVTGTLTLDDLTPEMESELLETFSEWKRTL